MPSSYPSSLNPSYLFLYGLAIGFIVVAGKLGSPSSIYCSHSAISTESNSTPSSTFFLSVLYFLLDGVLPSLFIIDGFPGTSSNSSIVSSTFLAKSNALPALTYMYLPSLVFSPRTSSGASSNPADFLASSNSGPVK